MKNKKKDLYEKFGSTLIWFIIGLVIIAASIALTFRFSKYGDELKIQDYFAYAGSFGGAILSAGISFFILFITIERGKIEQEENMLNSARPILKINFNNIGNSHNYKIYYIKTNSKENSPDRLNFSIKNIGTGPARNLKIKIEDEYVTTFGGLIEKNDVGINEEILIDLRTKYNKLLTDDYCNLFIECTDIYNKRQYISEVKAVRQTGHTSIEYYEVIEERCIEL